jgi:hypothetical protein
MTDEGCTEYPYLYSWRLNKLYGPAGSPLYRKRCRVLARGAMNARMVEFEDGTRHIISGNALRKAKNG